MITAMGKSQILSISELCTIIDCEHKTAPYVESSNYLVVCTNNVRDGILVLKDIKYTTENAFKEWTKRAIPEYGDLLFTREAPAGETCLVPKELNICMGQRMVLLRPNKKLINSCFLSLYLISGKCKREISEYCIGSTVTRINIDDILKIKIFCPPIPEQEKIASFLSAVDKKLTQLRRKKELLEIYKRGLMQKIFSQQIRFKQDDGRAFPDWQEKKLGELFKWIKTNNLSRENLNYNSGIVQNIHYGDIHTKFKSRFSLKKEKVPYINDLDYVSNLDEESFCKQGDLVIVDASEDYTEIGKTIEIIEVESNKLVAGLHCFLARPKDDFIFVLGYPGHLFQSQIIRDQIRKLAQGISVLGISKSNLEKILIPYPHLQEQQKIADFLTALDKKIEAVSQQIHHTEQFKKGLLQKMFV